MNSVREQDIKSIISRIPYQKCEGKIFLITGANGFLASYLIDTLMFLNKNYLQNKCTVIALCRNRKKAEKRFAEWDSDENFHFCVQRVEQSISNLSGVDYIVHAASSSVSADFKRIPADILNANIFGTYQLLEFARCQEVKSFLFFSSGAVYGEFGCGQKEIKESDYFPLDFSREENCYAEGKRSGEALCKAYFKQYGVPARIVRIGHTYGPGIDLKDGHVYSDFVSKIIEGKNLAVNNGSVVRPFCYILDAAVAFFLILLNGKNGETYNMVNGTENFSIYELAMKLVQEAFPERKLNLYCRKTDDNIQKIIVNTDKLLSLGWQPEIDIIEGFRRTVKSVEEEMQNG